MTQVAEIPLCDVCHVRAVVQVLFEIAANNFSDLYFCGHHGAKNRAAVEQQGGLYIDWGLDNDG